MEKIGLELLLTCGFAKLGGKVITQTLAHLTVINNPNGVLLSGKASFLVEMIPA